MDRAASIARVTLLGATGVRPALTPADVASIVDSHAIADSAGLAPAAPGWAETYDVNAAVAEVFRTKAAQVAADFNFSADDASFSKGDVLAHLLEMEAKYAAMAGSSTGTGTSGAGTIEVSGTNGPRTIDYLADRLVP